MGISSPSKIGVWLLAIRPRTLPAAIAPVVVGSSFAIKLSDFQILPGAAALLGALLLQIAANFANDYYDFLKGTDPEDRLGPPRVSALGLLSAREVKLGLIFTIVLSMIVGLYLISIRGVIILVIGLLSILALITYSGTVIAFGYRALGDLFVFLFFGIIAVNGTYFVHSGVWETDVLIGSIAPGLLVTAILVVNNYRDFETDRKTGKKTLAVVIGKNWTFIEYVVLLTVPYLTLIYFISQDYGFIVLLPILTIYQSFSLIMDLRRNEGKALNATLAKTAQTSLYFNILFAIGIVI